MQHEKKRVKGCSCKGFAQISRRRWEADRRRRPGPATGDTCWQMSSTQEVGHKKTKQPKQLSVVSLHREAEQNLLQTDDGDFLLLLQLSALLRQLIVHLAAAHDDPLEALLLRGVGRPAVPHSLQLWPTLPMHSSLSCMHTTAAACYSHDHIVSVNSIEINKTTL